MEPPCAVCDRCLGRRVMGAQGSAEQMAAGATTREEYGWPEVAAVDCDICEDAFQDLPRWLESAIEASKAWSFKSFQIGTRFPEACEAAEKQLVKMMDPEIGDSIRTEANRLLAAALAEATGTEALPGGRPDLVLHVDTRFWDVSGRANSRFIAGRYTKTSRELPQTHWPCKDCQGRGCHACDDAGVMYPSSVEDEIAAVLVPAFEAEGASFHGAGREDIDALMLGTGRPFVLEVHNPKHAEIDLAAVESTIQDNEPATHVGVQQLRMTQKEEVAAIKAGEYDKAYLAHCETESSVTQEQVQAAAQALSGQELAQQTPQRVAHRRADLVRNRTVHEVAVENFDDDRHFTLRVVAESGTYIKEFVSSDEGRTTPSFAAQLGVPTVVAMLDVLGILENEA